MDNSYGIDEKTFLFPDNRFNYFLAVLLTYRRFVLLIIVFYSFNGLKNKIRENLLKVFHSPYRLLYMIAAYPVTLKGLTCSSINLIINIFRIGVLQTSYRHSCIFSNNSTELNFYFNKVAYRCLDHHSTCITNPSNAKTKASLSFRRNNCSSQR